MNIKKKIIYLSLIFIICFVSMGKIFAVGLDFTVTATADKLVVSAGDEVKVRIKLKSDSNIYGCTFRTEYSSTLTELSVKAINNWETGFEGIGGTTENYVITNKDLSVDLSSGVEVLELSYEINGNGKLSIITDSCIEFVNETTGTYVPVELDFTVNNESDVTTLSSINVTNGIVEKFASNDLEAIINLDSPIFGLSLTTTNPDYKNFVTLTDNKGNKINDLTNITFIDDNNDNIMTLFATVNNDTRYTLKIKYENQNLDNSLSLLKVNNQVIDLIKDKYNYVVNIDKNIKDIQIVATLSDSENFQFASGNGPGNFILSENTSTIKLKVEPKNNNGAKSVTYTLELIKVDNTDGENTSKPSNDGSQNNSDDNIINPPTGNIFLFFVVIILLSSLIGSLFIYKNVEEKKKN